MASKKGTQGKNASANNNKPSASRHSTPLTDASPSTPLATPSSAPPMPAKDTPYLKTQVAALVNSDPSIEELIEKSHASISKPGDPPTARHLHELHDKIAATVNKFMSKRGEVCDRSMRQLVQRRKERLQEEREQQAAREVERARMKKEEERAARKEREKEKDKTDKTPSKKRTHDEMDVDADDADADEKERKEQRASLPSVGAHGVARQDGVGVHQGADAPPSPPVQPGTVAPELMDTATSPHSPSDSDASRSDPPATAPLYERIFGKDPTAAHDHIRYHIPDINDDMSYEEKREILQVAQWPESDLRDLIAGDPPDKDFSNAKPANQVNFSTFQTYVEPYIRAFTEEDVAFLKERGDRTAPYVTPKRGERGYKEVWAAEDGDAGIAPPKQHLSNPNEARGSIDDLDDDIADQDTVSLGPIMNRLLSVVRPQPSNAAKKDDTEDANGDTSMVNGDDDAPVPLPNGTVEDQKPVTYLPPDYPKATVPTLDYETLDTRLLTELRYMGFLDKEDLDKDQKVNYDAHNDDEVAARLRTLQDALRTISRQNNIRKARVLELTEERMAMQEYSNIADDLDNQVNAAYLKRNRSLAKPNQKKGAQNRPGQKGVASAPAGRGVSDGVRALMQKRKDWIDMVGPVVGFGRPPIPTGDETVFDEANHKRLEKLEKEAEAGEAEVE